MTESAVKMITDLGGTTIDIGTCLPAQARILVKKKHAKWQDGKLVVSMRPVHLAVAVNHQDRDRNDPNVSNAELDRRLDWLRGIMRAVVQSDTHGSDLNDILGYNLDPKPTFSGIEWAQNVTKEVLNRTIAARGPERLYGPLDKEDVVSDVGVLEEEEADHYYRNEDGNLPDIPLEDMEKFWPTAPDVKHRFGIRPTGFVAGTAIVQTLPVYDKGDLAEIKVLPVKFTFNQRLRDEAHPQESPESRPCPTCGQGTDTDGDGSCGVCGPLLRPR